MSPPSFDYLTVYKYPDYDLPRWYRLFGFQLGSLDGLDTVGPELVGFTHQASDNLGTFCIYHSQKSQALAQ